MKKRSFTFTTDKECWDSSPAPCVVLLRSGRVTFVNTAAEKLFAMDRTFIEERSIGDFFSPADALIPVLRSRKRVISSGVIEGTLTSRNGNGIPVTLHLQIGRPAKGRAAPVMAWISSRLEISELRSRLEKSEKLSAIAIVAGKVAHEIRRPLNSIFLNSDLLQGKIEKVRGPQGKKVLHYIDILQEEVGRVNEIVESYLSLGQLAKGERQSVRIEDFLRDVIAEVSGRFSRDGIAFVTAPRAKKKSLSIKPQQIRRVLLNLFSNSRDAMKKGGLITVSTEDTSGGYRITVSDNGEGIPSDFLSRLTTPFTSLKGNGSGLGLYLTREIIQNHGGRMEIQSLQGEGTSVILTLPSARRKRASSRSRQVSQ